MRLPSLLLAALLLLAIPAGDAAARPKTRLLSRSPHTRLKLRLGLRQHGATYFRLHGRHDRRARRFFRPRAMRPRNMRRRPMTRRGRRRVRRITSQMRSRRTRARVRRMRALRR
jgi:hypothetical protein